MQPFLKTSDGTEAVMVVGLPLAAALGWYLVALRMDYLASSPVKNVSGAAGCWSCSGVLMARRWHGRWPCHAHAHLLRLPAPCCSWPRFRLSWRQRPACCRRRWSGHWQTRGLPRRRVPSAAALAEGAAAAARTAAGVVAGGATAASLPVTSPSVVWAPMLAASVLAVTAATATTAAAGRRRLNSASLTWRRCIRLL